MTDAVQQVLSKLIDNAPAIIAAVASGWVVVWRSNKKTEESAKGTNDLTKQAIELVASNTDKLGEVHEQVNGNLSVEKARGDALAAELEATKKELARHKTARRGAKGSP